jgi:predicted RecB family nuclease
MLLTAELLLNYQRCSRRAFLDSHGEASARDQPSDYLQKLFQDSIENHRAILGEDRYDQPRYPYHDWSAGAAATRALMAQGAARIYQGVLLAEVDGVTLVSKPDLLIKQPGESVFGDWMYAPTEIKLSKRSKAEYQIIAAFHVKLLAAMQGSWCEQSWLLLKEKGAYAVDLWDLIPRMEEILADCIATLQSDQAPEVFIARNRCSLCHWYSHCYEIATADRHLSLLPGITAPRYAELQILGVTTVEALAETAPSDLEMLPGFGLETARKVVRQAQVTLADRALPTEAYCRRRPLPSAPVELYFDIESEPSLNLIYLHGVLVVDHAQGTQTFHSLLAPTPEQEGQVWQQFLDLVWAYPDAPIFHFCPYETQTVGKLAHQYNLPEHLLPPLLARFFDIHDYITQIAILPVESYALKHIARWMGFDWRDASANGAQSIFWYAQWLATGDRAFLDSIAVYNEDDCRATFHIKVWLDGFLKELALEGRSAS